MGLGVGGSVKQENLEADKSATLQIVHDPCCHLLAHLHIHLVVLWDNKETQVSIGSENPAVQRITLWLTSSCGHRLPGISFMKEFLVHPGKTVFRYNASESMCAHDQQVAMTPH